MNMLHLILLSFVQVSITIGGPTESSILKPCIGAGKCIKGFDDKSLPLDNVILKIQTDNEAILHVQLRQTKRALANEHLPVWVLKGVVDADSIDDEDSNELERDTEVMKQLGAFTTYQDVHSSSAAVYYHKRGEFDGMINYKYLIEKFSISEIVSNPERIYVPGKYGINIRPAYKGHKNPPDSYQEDSHSGVNNQKLLKTYKSRLYDGYPEVLVIVTWEVAQSLIKTVEKSKWYTTIVSYVLTLFNGVDMLYSKLQDTKIQINIAGIVIGTEAKSFLFMKDCYYEITDEAGQTQDIMDGNCLNDIFQSYLSARFKTFPVDSYDLAIVLTKEALTLISESEHDNDDEIEYELSVGISGVVHDLYEYKKESLVSTLIGCVVDDGNLGYYTVIAHEMAHLMTVFHDDNAAFTNNGNCCGYLMKEDGRYWCKKCLSWSQTSQATLKLFFSSPNCCTFINKPRSLHLPGRYKMLTADEQCQCYGYKSAEISLDCHKNICDSELQCNDGHNKFYDSLIPMDGTPCGHHKVCWQMGCENIEIFKK